MFFSVVAVNQLFASLALVTRAVALFRLFIDSVVAGRVNLHFVFSFHLRTYPPSSFFHFYKSGAYRDIYSRERGSEILVQKHR